jgi:ubiquinone/menaquinone biosynthesis C-methylase UbiE
MSPPIHPTAQSGFDQSAQAYSKGRPDYPTEALDFMQSNLGLTNASKILEVGAGTGKMTNLLAQRGFKIQAVEPVAGMRAQFKKELPEIPIMQGTAEALPCASESYDAIVVAQAFHWFKGPKALQEFARVLKPGGPLILIWNARDESYAWIRQMRELMDPHEGQAPRYHSGEWRKAFATPQSFSPLHEKSFRHEHQGNVDIFVDRVASVSFIAALPHIERTRILHQVRSLIETAPELKNVSPLTMPYRTDLYWCSKLSPP